MSHIFSDKINDLMHFMKDRKLIPFFSVWMPPSLSDISILPLERISCSSLNLPLCPDSEGVIDRYSTLHIQVSVYGEESEGFSIVRYNLFSWQCLTFIIYCKVIDIKQLSLTFLNLS